MKKIAKKELKNFLNLKVLEYNQPEFIASDPISVPHLFRLKEDIEIAGFFSATLSWGQRPVIIKNAKRLMNLMDNAPFEFVMGHHSADLKRFDKFVHRTFQPEDCRFFTRSLRKIYAEYGGLELAFFRSMSKDQQVFFGLQGLRNLILSLPHIVRQRKHIPDPDAGSAAKRMNMFLRWMVRKDPSGVDFGLWKTIPASCLICPLDVHSGRTARKLGLLKRIQNDWKAAMELTLALREFDEADPVKYDYALFGLGMFERF